MKSLIFSLLLLSFLSTAIADGDPVIGKSTSILCIGCHGFNGNSTNPEYPKLAGQGEEYLEKQLRDFKSGARKEEHMTSMVDAIQMTDIPNLAAYFSSQKRAKTDPGKTANEVGKKIYQEGISAKAVPACTGCHGLEAAGVPAAGFPSLANQHVEYIAKILRDFRQGVRGNDQQMLMRNIASKLSDAEIDAVATYLANY